MKPRVHMLDDITLSRSQIIAASKIMTKVDTVWQSRGIGSSHRCVVLPESRLKARLPPCSRNPLFSPGPAAKQSIASAPSGSGLSSATSIPVPNLPSFASSRSLNCTYLNVDKRSSAANLFKLSSLRIPSSDVILQSQPFRTSLRSLQP